jgi:hypothetical protein
VFQPFMAHQQLDGGQVGAGLQQMRGKATDGADRWRSSQQRNSSTAGWGKERVLQRGRNTGQFRRSGFGSPTVGGGPYENCFTLSANSRMGI